MSSSIGSRLQIRQSVIFEAMANREPNQTNSSDAGLEALRYGIDINLIDYNLRLSPDERIQQHEAALKLVRELLTAREALYSKP